MLFHMSMYESTMSFSVVSVFYRDPRQVFLICKVHGCIPHGALLAGVGDPRQSLRQDWSGGSDRAFVALLWRVNGVNVRNRKMVSTSEPSW